MSKQTVCDNDLCTEVYETDDDVRQMWWIKVGWVHDAPRDACSVDCARVILEDLLQRQWEIEQIPSDTPS